jgi:hypothetical protein
MLPTLHQPAGTTPNAMQPEGRINVRFRRLEPEEDRSLATCNIVVMEYCDKGSLRHAMKRGVFHKRLGSTSVAVDLCAIVQVGGYGCVCVWGGGQGLIEQWQRENQPLLLLW